MNKKWLKQAATSEPRVNNAGDKVLFFQRSRFIRSAASYFLTALLIFILYVFINPKNTDINFTTILFVAVGLGLGLASLSGLGFSLVISPNSICSEVNWIIRHHNIIVWSDVAQITYSKLGNCFILHRLSGGRRFTVSIYLNGINYLVDGFEKHLSSEVYKQAKPMMDRIQELASLKTIEPLSEEEKAASKLQASKKIVRISLILLLTGFIISVLAIFLGINEAIRQPALGLFLIGAAVFLVGTVYLIFGVLRLWRAGAGQKRTVWLTGSLLLLIVILGGETLLINQIFSQPRQPSTSVIQINNNSQFVMNTEPRTFKIDLIVTNSDKEWTAVNVTIDVSIFGADGSLTEKLAIKLNPPNLGPGMNGTHQQVLELPRDQLQGPRE